MSENGQVRIQLHAKAYETRPANPVSELWLSIPQALNAFF